MPLFQNESKCETFHENELCMQFQSHFCTWTRFETEAEGRTGEGEEEGGRGVRSLARSPNRKKEDHGSRI